jgi:hypothetical protein
VSAQPGLRADGLRRQGARSRALTSRIAGSGVTTACADIRSVLSDALGIFRLDTGARFRGMTRPISAGSVCPGAVTIGPFEGCIQSMAVNVTLQYFQPHQVG